MRNPGMFFLRQVVLHEGGGEEFLRRQFGCSPVRHFRWSLVDSRIAAFAATDKLPKVMLVHVRSSVIYIYIHADTPECIAEMLTSMVRRQPVSRRST